MKRITLRKDGRHGVGRRGEEEGGVGNQTGTGAGEGYENHDKIEPHENVGLI